MNVTELPATVQLASSCADDTAGLAAMIAKQCGAGDCILLSGDLGVGKTHFARAFIRALSSMQEEVLSPTFTLAQTYVAHSGIPIWHFDLYRMEDAEEAQEIGVEEALRNGISLIEWPHIIRDMLPQTALDIRMAYGKHPQQRSIIIKSDHVRWQGCLESIGSFFSVA